MQARRLNAHCYRSEGFRGGVLRAGFLMVCTSKRFAYNLTLSDLFTESRALRVNKVAETFLPRLRYIATEHHDKHNCRVH
jgi:hypothetical protein